MRSRWTDFGFDSDVFGLFVKMKGGKTQDSAAGRALCSPRTGCSWRRSWAWTGRASTGI